VVSLRRNDGQHAPEYTKSTSEKESYNNFTPVLNQNAPNPFNSKTTISYFIPKEVKSANLYFYNLEGKQLRSIPIDTRENGTTVFDGGEFVPGMYYYTLILDGNEIDTKKMIITD
jgi:hypothetical protein